MGDIIKEFISLMSFSHVIVVKLSGVAGIKSHVTRFKLTLLGRVVSLGLSPPKYVVSFSCQ